MFFQHFCPRNRSESSVCIFCHKASLQLSGSCRLASLDGTIFKHPLLLESSQLQIPGIHLKAINRNQLQKQRNCPGNQHRFFFFSRLKPEDYFSKIKMCFGNCSTAWNPKSWVWCGKKSQMDLCTQKIIRGWCLPGINQHAYTNYHRPVSVYTC